MTSNRMIKLITHDNGLITLQSPLLRTIGVKHGFSTRVGGACSGDYTSLHLGLMDKGVNTPGSGGNTAVAENFRRLRRALDLDRHPRMEVRQVHGNNVWVCPDKPVRLPHVPEADALITDTPRQMLTIRTADCAAILLATRSGRCVAAVHAGWRGTAAGVVHQAVDRLCDHAATSASDLVAAVGPCIGAQRFGVGSEVVAAFGQAKLESAIVTGSPTPPIDLAKAVTTQLLAAGVPTSQIDCANLCTYERDDLFFSHRRDVTHHGQSDTGRMAAVISPGH